MTTQPVMPQVLSCSLAVMLAGLSHSVQAQCLESEGIIVGSRAVESDNYGSAISISGEWMAVGAPFAEARLYHSGIVYMYHREGPRWVEQSIIPDPTGRESDRFGSAVSVSGNKVLISVPGADLGATDSGAAIVYAWNGAQWVMEDVLAPQMPQLYDGLGMTVLLNGDDAYVGYPGVDLVDREEGVVRTYHFDGAHWNYVNTIALPDPHPVDSFGCTLKMSGDQLLIGVLNYIIDDVHVGAVMAYRFTDGQWIQDSVLTAPDPTDQDRFGYSMAVHGNWAVVGILGRDNQQGLAYVYKRDGNTWTEHTELRSPDPTNGSEFGTGLGINDDLIVVGQPDSLGHGRAYRFRLTGDEWVYEDRMRDVDTYFNESYGSVIAMTPDSLVINASHTPTVHRLGAICPYDLNGRCGATLSAETGCNAEMFDLTVRWNGATPSGRVALIHSAQRGFLFIPGNLSCAGTWLGLNSMGAQVVYQTNSGPNGAKVLDGRGGRALCGTYLQLIDLQTCTPSNVVRLDRDTSW